MTQKNKDEALTPDEKKAFSALNRNNTPPPLLEQKIVSELKARKLIYPEKTTFSWSLPRLAAAFLAVIVLISFGFSLGKWQSAAATTYPEKPLFVLFLYDSQQQAEKDEMALVKEYGNWIGNFRAAGQFAAGEKLKNSGKVLRNIDHKLNVTNSNEVASYGKISGYFLIEAENIE